MARPFWLRRLFTRPVTRPIRKARTCRPQLEALEDRLAPAVYHVTSLDDFNYLGTLRYAITQANTNPGPDTIDSQITGPGSLFQVPGTILLQDSPLPAFTDPAT